MDLCSCGRPATCYCDWYFVKLKKGEPKSITACEKPVCDECKIESHIVKGMLCTTINGEYRLIDNTVDYCPEHGKIYRETGKLFEAV